MKYFLLAALTAASLCAQVAPPNDMGISVGHIHLIVSDTDAQKKFWSDLLGAQYVKVGFLDMYKIPGVFIVVQKAGRTAPTEGSDGSTVNHFGFLVKNFDETRKKLADAGLKFTMDNAQTRQVIVETPEKVRIEFSEDKTITVPMKFHHIHEANADQAAVRDWYVKTFGGTAGTRGAFPAAFVPGGEVDVLKATTEVAATKGRVLDHIGFEVKNLEDFCKKLDAAGMKFDMKYTVVQQLDGLKIAFILDPWGTRIELTEGLTNH